MRSDEARTTLKYLEIINNNITKLIKNGRKGNIKK